MSKISSRKSFLNSKTLILICLLVAASIIFLWKIFAATNPLIFTQPATTTVAPGAAVNVQVRMDSGADPVNVVQLNVSYPTDKLQFTGFDTTGTAFPTDIASKDNGGTIEVSRYVASGTAAPSGNQLITTLKFNVLAGATGSAAISFGSTQYVVRSTDNANLYTSGNSAGSTITIQTVAKPPTVSITSPSSSYTAPANITINPTYTVDSSRTVKQIDYYNGATLIGTQTTAPYTFSWQSVPAGSYSVTAKITDSANATATSNALPITVGQTPSAPTVTLSTNGTSFVVGDTITLTSNVTPFTGRTITAMNFLNGTSAIKSFTTNQSSYTYSFKPTAAGNYNFSANATDNGQPALTGTSSIIAVSVGNAPPVRPTPPTNLNSTGKSQTSVSLSWTAPSGVAVDRYIVTRNGNDLPATITGTSFTDSGLSANTAYTYTVKAVNAGGTSDPSNSISVTTDPKPHIPGDINNDGTVNNSDFLLLASRWGSTDASADVNGNGKVDGYDFVILFKNYGKSN